MLRRFNRCLWDFSPKPSIFGNQPVSSKCRPSVHLVAHFANVQLQTTKCTDASAAQPVFLSLTRFKSIQPQSNLHPALHRRYGSWASVQSAPLWSVGPPCQHFLISSWVPLVSYSFALSSPKSNCHRCLLLSRLPCSPHRPGFFLFHQCTGRPQGIRWIAWTAISSFSSCVSPDLQWWAFVSYFSHLKPMQ